MSKDEILKKYDGEYMDRDDISSAMDEYAKQEAIEFAKWKYENYVEPHSGYGYVTKNDFYSIEDLNSIEKLHIPTLYEIFLQSKK